MYIWNQKHFKPQNVNITRAETFILHFNKNHTLFLLLLFLLIFSMKKKRYLNSTIHFSGRISNAFGMGFFILANHCYNNHFVELTKKRGGIPIFIYPSLYKERKRMRRKVRLGPFQWTYAVCIVIWTIFFTFFKKAK